MKKLAIAVVLCLCTALFSGCGNTDKTDKSSPDTTKSTSSDGIDLDLTKMSSTMVYSTVYSMMTKPEDYIGKKIRVTGNFNAYHNDQTDKTYFSVIIADATACCQQGLEFDLGSSCKYPDDYPHENALITVTGDFTTYMENNYEYCQLKNASYKLK
ncbi:hypothetical protein [Ruminococcus sp.]|uniref:hypothetical protein n=1 Tax=Ruminococcus sp. TaxID=41978 RepID=UPI0025DB5412|nr:hypothetical protein [Ruminococcus sp.]MCR4639440.1 hypothetical protein [Ruminococcus sp.]